jgi:hypothetical protein
VGTAVVLSGVGSGAGAGSVVVVLTGSQRASGRRGWGRRLRSPPGRPRSRSR